MSDAFDYVDLPYEIRISAAKLPDGSWAYLAEHLELPGVMSQGGSPEQVVELLRYARRMAIESLLAQGEDVPLPAVMLTA